MTSIFLRDNEDFFIWDGKLAQGMVTIKEVYKYIAQPQYASIEWECFKKIALGRSFARLYVSYSWLGKKKKLTWDNLYYRGFNGSGWCVLCKGSLEDVIHLLLNCSVAVSICGFVVHILKIIVNWDYTFAVACIKGWLSCYKKFWTLPFYIIWVIWKCRNGCIFEQQTIDINQTYEHSLPL